MLIPVGHILEIRKALNVGTLLRIERSQLRWFSHVPRMSQERLSRQALLAKPSGKRPRGRPRPRWSNYISDLAWSRLGVEPAELSEIAVDREVFRVLWVLTPQPSLEEKWARKWVIDIFAGCGLGTFTPGVIHCFWHCLRKKNMLNLILYVFISKFRALAAVRLPRLSDWCWKNKRMVTSQSLGLFDETITDNFVVCLNMYIRSKC